MVFLTMISSNYFSDYTVTNYIITVTNTKLFFSQCAAPRDESISLWPRDKSPISITLAAG